MTTRKAIMPQQQQAAAFNTAMCSHPNHSAKHRGITLIELALVIFLLALALIPIVKMIGGKADGGRYLTSNEAGRVSNRRVAAGSSVMENGLATYNTVLNPTFSARPGDPPVASARTLFEEKNIGTEFVKMAVNYDWITDKPLFGPHPSPAKGNQLIRANYRGYEEKETNRPGVLLATNFGQLARSYALPPSGELQNLLFQDDRHYVNPDVSIITINPPPLPGPDGNLVIAPGLPRTGVTICVPRYNLTSLNPDGTANCSPEAIQDATFNPPVSGDRGVCPVTCTSGPNCGPCNAGDCGGGGQQYNQEGCTEGGISGIPPQT